MAMIKKNDQNPYILFIFYCTCSSASSLSNTLKLGLTHIENTLSRFNWWPTTEAYAQELSPLYTD